MGNEAYRDGDKLQLMKDPENLEEEVINDVLMQGFEGEKVDEEDLEDLL